MAQPQEVEAMDRKAKVMGHLEAKDLDLDPYRMEEEEGEEEALEDTEEEAEVLGHRVDGEVLWFQTLSQLKTQ